jgi:hypothetical protein
MARAASPAPIVANTRLETTVFTGLRLVEAVIERILGKAAQSSTGPVGGHTIVERLDRQGRYCSNRRKEEWETRLDLRTSILDPAR